MPSSPAHSVTASARYGLHDGSGTRSSTPVAASRRAGTRTSGLRLCSDQAMLVGASKPGHQALVGVHERVGDRAEALGVAQQPGDVVEARAAQLPRRVGVEEGVVAVGAEQRLQQVQARSVPAVDRLGHEGGVQAVLLGDVLDDEAERADVVGGDQHVVLAEVDLVLAGGDLVVRRLDVDADRLERQDDLPPHVLAEVDGREVEIAGGVVRVGGGLAVARLEEEELRLRSAVHRVAGGRRLGDGALQRRAVDSPRRGCRPGCGCRRSAGRSVRRCAASPAAPGRSRGRAGGTCPTPRSGRSPRSTSRRT